MPAVLAPLLGLTLAQAMPAAVAPTGSFLLNGQRIERLALQQITYLGDCPGEEQPEVRGVSFVAAAPPAPYQRILIRNQATGGYTDREYDERRPSAQTFSVALGQGQRGSFLTLVPGLNSFTYQVNNRIQNRTLDQGTANLQVALNRFSQNRSFQDIREDRYCSGQKNLSRTSLDACPNGLITLERIGVCPGGRTVTLSMETVGSGNRPGGGWGNRPGGGWSNPPAGNSWGGNGGSGFWSPRY